MNRPRNQSMASCRLPQSRSQKEKKDYFGFLKSFKNSMSVAYSNPAAFEPITSLFLGYTSLHVFNIIKITVLRQIPKLTPQSQS